MKKLILCIALGFQMVAYSQQTNWQQQVNLKIDVTLNDLEHTLDGFQTIEYTNNSPDTLNFIWFHLWPNAYKSDKTAFSEYRLLERKTDFYFSGKYQKGYINQLDFKVNNIPAKLEDHPHHLDIVKLILPRSLAPNETISITTPFHVQLPYNFSGNGYSKDVYQIVQWHPQPAKYDASGWHAMPFETIARNYSQEGSYDISITLPKEYTLHAAPYIIKETAISTSTKTISFQESNLQDFTWVATRPSPPVIKKQSVTPKKKPYKAEEDKKLIILNEVVPAKLFDTSKTKSISLLPSIGYNLYDGFMVGGLVHNYLSKTDRLQFVAVPMFGTTSKALVGIGRASYQLANYKDGATLSAALDLARFSTKRGLDSNNNQLMESFFKIAPSIRYNFSKANTTSTLEKWIEFKSFLIGESSFERFHIKSTDGLIYVEGLSKEFRYVNQLTYSTRNNRVLYPYDYQFQFQQGKEFYRINATSHYFFNYSKGGGANLRLFGAKFGYMNKSLTNQYYTARYQPKLTGNTGEDDYTYNNYFVGRTASVSYGEDAVVKNNGIAAQQIMIRDGGFKLRTDQYTYLEGRSDNWILAMNLNTTLPRKLFPFELPVKLFLDIGTTAEAWKKDYEEQRFLFNAGLQVSLFREVLNIYIPLIFSDVYKDYFNSWPKDKRVWKTLSFSLDIQNLRVKKSRIGV